MSKSYRPTQSPRRNFGEFLFAVLSITGLCVAAVAAAVILALGV